MTLRQLLWLDATAGGTTALIGLTCYRQLGPILGLPPHVLLVIAAVTGVYALVAGSLALRPNRGGLRLLVTSNWAWTVVSLVLLRRYWAEATALGNTFLVLQVLVVAGLAWAEGRFLKASEL